MKPTRRILQAALLTLTLVGVFAVGANCERWCPFGGVEALYTYAAEGNMVCSLGTSNFFILGGVLLVTLLLRRAFCGYLCPIGTISEWTRALGRRLGIPPLRIAPGVDRGLSLLKYPVLALILAATWRSGELLFRGYDPCYALLSRHGEDITYWAYVISALILLASLAIVMPFCRWFCPLAAVLNPFSRWGLMRIHRDPQHCHDCGRCVKRCPMAISVDQVQQVTAARCLSCFECLEACPQGRSAARAISWGPPAWLGRRWSPAALVPILLLCTSAAVAASYLFPLPSFIKTRGQAPSQTARLELVVDDLTCRGRANLLVYFLDRDDMFQVPGYLRVEAWPGPTAAHLHIRYDPSQTNELAIQQAITEPYFETDSGNWRPSPFRIAGYDPLGLAAPLP
ncbi:MAG: 4Fe-4S binding protein [Pirellulaceae bacterium]|nr:4Fe-4S binding protein [Pirellulaceae bacterium]